MPKERQNTGLKLQYSYSAVSEALSLSHTHMQAVFTPTYCRSGLASAQGEQTDARVTTSQLAMGLIDAQWRR